MFLDSHFPFSGFAKRAAGGQHLAGVVGTRVTIIGLDQDAITALQRPCGEAPNGIGMAAVIEHFDDNAFAAYLAAPVLLADVFLKVEVCDAAS